MPKLWSDTIAAHRREVHDAILETTAARVAELGLRAVTMSQIAQETRIGRATLYKYFPDVEAILVAWHERHVAAHLAQLAELRDHAGDPRQQLDAVLNAYAFIAHERARQHHGAEVAALVHQGQRVAQAENQLRGFLRDLLEECARIGDVRDDVAPEELASYCLYALEAASGLSTRAAVRRLVAVTLAGLRTRPKLG